MTTDNGAPPSDVAGAAAAAGDASLVGHRFGNYQVARRLASGGMGEVFLLRHRTLEDKYRVLKTILPEFSARADIRERFDREARAVAQLGDHPQIVGIDDYGMMEDGRLWMMMPFVHGQPLDEYLRAQGGLLPAYRVLELLIDVALALDHAHGRSIIHRDVKPSNVFVLLTAGAPACKLLDFGIARHRGNNAVSQTHFALGTPSYMAAEQYEHASEADVTADVYALACMAWEMESGTPPWPDADVAVLYHQKLNVPPPPPRAGAMSPEREAFLRSCVVPNPAMRPQSVRHFIAGYAATLPSASRFVPSGTQLLERRASILLERAALETTVRRPDDAGATPFPGLSAVSAVHRTTLGAASVAISAAATRSAPRPSRMISIGTVVAIVVGIGVYAVASQRGGTSTTTETSRPATSSPRSPSATPVTDASPTSPVSSAAPKLPQPIYSPSPALSSAAVAPSTTAVRSESPVSPPAPSGSTLAAPALAPNQVPLHAAAPLPSLAPSSAPTPAPSSAPAPAPSSALAPAPSSASAPARRSASVKPSPRGPMPRSLTSSSRDAAPAATPQSRNFDLNAPQGE